MSHVDLKVVLLGKEFSGKTSLVERWLNGRFAGENKYQNTIGAAYGAKQMEHDGKIITMGVWDTAGSERYEAMSRIYYRGAKAAILCYDVSDLESWEKVSFWMSEVRKFGLEGCKMYLCGTKTDLLTAPGKAKKKRTVDYHNAADFAENNDSRMFETSSKTGENVDELFQCVANDYIDDPVNSYTDLDGTEKADLSNEWRKARGEGCCRGGGGGEGRSRKRYHR